MPLDRHAPTVPAGTPIASAISGSVSPNLARISRAPAFMVRHSLQKAKDLSNAILCDLRSCPAQDGSVEKHERLRFARQRRFKSGADAARYLNIPYGTYAGHEVGTRGIKDEEAIRYARAFRVPVEWLVYGKGSIDGGNTVAVVGLIGAGGVIETGSEQPDSSGNLFEIEVPFPVPSGATAFRVVGDSMWPRYDSDDVVICFAPSHEPELLVGREAAVCTPQGNRFLKRLMRGPRRGVFVLESHNAPPIRDVTLEWAADIFATVRALHWQRIGIAPEDRGARRARRLKT